MYAPCFASHVTVFGNIDAAVKLLGGIWQISNGANTVVRTSGRKELRLDGVAPTVSVVVPNEVGNV